MILAEGKPYAKFYFLVDPLTDIQESVVGQCSTQCSVHFPSDISLANRCSHMSHVFCVRTGETIEEKSQDVCLSIDLHISLSNFSAGDWPSVTSFAYYSVRVSNGSCVDSWILVATSLS